MQTETAPVAAKPRLEVSVFWKPGCSSCLKAKEFVEEQGIPFESVNVFERDDAMDELLAAGLRGMPVVRKGDKYIYAQFIDDVAALLGVQTNRPRLSLLQLLERWENVLSHARDIIVDFDEDTLERRAMLTRDRSIKVLSSHVFQIAEAFMVTIDDGVVDTRVIGDDPREDIVTRQDLISYIDGMLSKYRDWRVRRGVEAIPARIATFYGEQPALPMVERQVWHSTQHTRQLDYIGAGLGSELRVPSELYASLPLPSRLWA